MHLQFHKGIDYAVVMRPNQSTEDALARLYGQDKDVTKFGNIFAAAPDLLEVLELIHGFNFALDDTPHGKEIRRRAEAAIAKAKSR